MSCLPQANLSNMRVFFQNFTTLTNFLSISSAASTGDRLIGRPVHNGAQEIEKKSTVYRQDITPQTVCSNKDHLTKCEENVLRTLVSVLLKWWIMFKTTTKILEPWSWSGNICGGRNSQPFRPRVFIRTGDWANKHVLSFTDGKGENKIEGMSLIRLLR